MKNEHDPAKKWILGLIIGGAVGAGTLYCIHAAQNRKTPVLKKIGKTISEVGEMLENCSESSTVDVIETIEKKMPSSVEVINSLSDWVSSGMSLWKNLQNK